MPSPLTLRFRRWRVRIGELTHGRAGTTALGSAFYLLQAFLARVGTVPEGALYEGVGLNFQAFADDIVFDMAGFRDGYGANPDTASPSLNTHDDAVRENFTVRRAACADYQAATAHITVHPRR